MTKATGNEGDAARAAVQKLVDKYGDEVLQWASQKPHHSYPNGHTLISVLEERGQRFGPVLDIGTARGMSALILAHWAESVCTIDIYESEWLPKIWVDTGVYDRITRRIVVDDAQKAAIVDELRFDMAFIDGDHTREGVQVDFDLAKRCGTLLFHDYPKAYPGCDGAGHVLGNDDTGVTTDCRPFAWWDVK